MKILLVTNYQPPHMGGIEFAAGSLKRCWDELGHEVTWMSTDIPRGAVESTADNIRIPAANFFENWFQINSPVVSPLSYRHIRKVIAAHDVVNVHSLAPGLTNDVLRMTLDRKKPMVVTQHVGIIELKLSLMGAVQREVYRREAKKCIASAVDITFVGQAVRDWFVEQFHIPAERFTMTPAGIDQDSFYFVPDDERESIRKTCGLAGRFNVLFVGRFYEKKGLPLLRELAARCPDIQFTLVGSGPINPVEWGLENVRIIKFVSTEELRELYGSHDLFLMPSFGEGWPAVIPQAMACGLACLISEETFAGHEKAEEMFVVRPRTLDAMATALADAAAGNIPLVKQRKECSDYATRTWDWKRTAKIYEGLFEKALAAHRPGYQ